MTTKRDDPSHPDHWRNHSGRPVRTVLPDTPQDMDSRKPFTARGAPGAPLQDLPRIDPGRAHGAAGAPPQDLDPAQAERLHQLRQALGLSVNEMAARLGLWGANGADNLRQMERAARPLPGTLQVLLGLLEREGRAGRYRATLEAIANRLDDHELRQAAKDALADE